MLMTAEMDLVLKIPATFPLAIVEKLLMVIGEVDIGLRPETPPPVTQATMVDCCVYMLLLVMFIKVFMPIKDVIVVEMMEYVYLGLNIPSTIIFTIMDKVLMVMGDLDIGIRPTTIPTIIQVILLDH